MGQEKILYIVAILLQAGIIVYFVVRSRAGKKAKAEMKRETADENAYENLRTVAIQVTPAQLKLAIPDDETLVYGLVMDCHIGDVIVTLTAYITGAANMYFSNGGNKIGGGKTPAVGEVAVEFVTAAQSYVYRAIRVTATELCEGGCVRFYLLTNKGIHAAQEQLRYIEDGTSPWVSIFEKGNELINLMHSSGNGNIAH